MKKKIKISDFAVKSFITINEKSGFETAKGGKEKAPHTVQVYLWGC